MFGGYGYTKDYPMERMMRDAKITGDLRGHQRGAADRDRQPHGPEVRTEGQSNYKSNRMCEAGAGYLR